MVNWSNGVLKTYNIYNNTKLDWEMVLLENHKISEIKKFNDIITILGSNTGMVYVINHVFGANL